MYLNLNDIIVLVGASQGFFLAFLLLLKKDTLKINIPLIVGIILLSLRLVSDFLYDTEWIVKVVDWVYMLEPFNIALGLCIFLYVRNVIERKAIYNRRDIVMLIPLFIYFIYYGYYFAKGHEYRVYDVQQYMAEGEGFAEDILCWCAESVINGTFLLFTLFILKKYHIGVRNNYSDIENKELLSITILVFVLLIFYIIETIISIFVISGSFIPEYIYYFVYFGLIALLFSIGYNELIWSKKAVDISPTQERYKNSSLDIESSKGLSIKLKSFIEQNKPYLDSQLTLKKLAEMIDIQPYVLSQLINESFDCNFSEFINSYRIEEAKRLLRDPEYKNYTLTAIGFESGFNSKSAFYIAFKNFTGTTPAKY